MQVPVPLRDTVSPISKMKWQEGDRRLGRLRRQDMAVEVVDYDGQPIAV